MHPPSCAVIDLVLVLVSLLCLARAEFNFGNINICHLATCGVAAGEYTSRVEELQQSGIITHAFNSHISRPSRSIFTRGVKNNSLRALSPSSNLVPALL